MVTVVLKYRVGDQQRQTEFTNFLVVDGDWHTIILQFHTERSSTTLSLYVDCTLANQMKIGDKLSRVFSRTVIDGSEMRLGQAGYGMTANPLKVNQRLQWSYVSWYLDNVIT